ncbi:MAG: zf-HC2 domain-containing protein [Acidobacteriota bacterium]
MSRGLSCQRVAEMIYLFFDNEMDGDLRVSFEEHIDYCAPCAEQVQYTRRVLLTVRRRCVRRCAPRSLRDRILERMEHRRAMTRPGP